MGMDSDPVLCTRITLCSRNDYFGNYVQESGYLQHGYCTLHLLALSTLGHQTLLEPVCRLIENQALVGNQHAVAGWCRTGRNRFHHTHAKFFQTTLAIFWLVAFSSATHDIAADGFYMLALNVQDQALYVGIRSTFYRIATIAGQGLLVMLAGGLEIWTGSIKYGWSITFFILAGLFLAFCLYHKCVLPKPDSDKAVVGENSASAIFNGFIEPLPLFPQKQAGVAILFMLFYRFPEAQLVKLINPFLLDPVEKGGLGLTTAEVGLVYGTIGIIGLTLGGIVGGICAAKGGLQKWLWPMAWSLSLTCLTFVYLGYFQPQNFVIINLCVFIEQFGYGFGFTAYMLYLIYYSDGEHKTAHYAICTAFMALGMMLPGMAAGWLQELIGYENFFIWVMACCAATIAVCAFIKIDPDYGKKKENIAEEKK